jgi:hypothetical protein
MAERSQPTIIELLDIAEFTHHIESVVPLGEPIFQPYPPEVAFQEYEPFEVRHSHFCPPARQWRGHCAAAAESPLFWARWNSTACVAMFDTSPGLCAARRHTPWTSLFGTMTTARGA